VNDVNGKDLADAGVLLWLLEREADEEGRKILQRARRHIDRRVMDLLDRIIEKQHIVGS